ncbi:hypothetical protein B0H11DRAFT_2040916 [Mycena galericulata]|nr:hypothetical protein B0H11DRAFT_2040916 [Mycena galericulata]
MATAAPPLNFSAMAVEIQTLIASHMSPSDLARFSQTSNLSRAISNRPNLYENSLRRLHFPLHIPTPAASLSTFCSILFGGKCKVCGHDTDALPMSYTARIRVCGGPCSDALIKRRIITKIPPVNPQKPKQNQLLLECVKPWMPAVEKSIGRSTFYLKFDLMRAKATLEEAIRLDKFQGKGSAEFPRPREVALLQVWREKALNRARIMKTAQDVLYWQQYEYQPRREKLDKNTSKHLQWILDIRGLDLKSAEALRSPTLRRTIKSWHRDLQQLSPHAFSIIEPLVLREAFLAKAGVPPTAFEYHASDRILCPFCDLKKPFQPDGLILHIYHKHPDQFTRVRETYNVTKGFKYCDLCPRSMKKYAMDGMQKHIAAKHKS